MTAKERNNSIREIIFKTFNLEGFCEIKIQLEWEKKFGFVSLGIPSFDTLWKGRKRGRDMPFPNTVSLINSEIVLPWMVKILVVILAVPLSGMQEEAKVVEQVYSRLDLPIYFLNSSSPLVGGRLTWFLQKPRYSNKFL